MGSGVCGQRDYLRGHIAAPGPRNHVALRSQQGVGCLHGAHAHPQGSAQLPLGGQLFPRGDMARLDGGGDMAVELFVQGSIPGKDRHGKGGVHEHSSKLTL